ncbi:MAG: AAA family ATPase [Planctomycetaceae bacterium]|jgi:AAA15 family ATPase/GTPase|nr:AAA family ATPase [Planctomycetaceae bacterium]
MLISFELENWRSFRDKSTLNLVASREKQHSNRLPFIEKYKLKLLPTTAIYGGNASGKSNFFSAFRFAQTLVLEGIPLKSPIPVLPFRLDSDLEKLPTRFKFVIVVSTGQGVDTINQDECYEYSFAVSRSHVIEERLIWIKSTAEKILFARKEGEKTVFDSSIRNDENLYRILDSTRDNQLFLTNAANQNIEKYKTDKLIQVYRWFERLTLICPDRQVSTLAFWNRRQKDELHPLEHILSKMGTGITRLDFEDVDKMASPFPHGFIETALKPIPDGTSVLVTYFKRRYLLQRNSDAVSIKQLISFHASADSKRKTIRFDLADDSDGTIRVIDLLPCFLTAIEQNTGVYIIDELDRSLHTLLVRRLLEYYLSSCSHVSRSQIIFTTHDVMQMDQELLRRDEMCVTDRKNDGSTELIPFSSYRDIRKDKSVRTSYLHGQLGGVPNLPLNDLFSFQ